VTGIRPFLIVIPVLVTVLVTTAELEHRTDVVSLGWVSDMAALMAASDVVVQNAGGLTSLEARQSGLPVVTYRSLPGHGTTNNRGLVEAGWATWARDPGELPRRLAHALAARVVAAVPGEIPWLRLTPGSTPVPA
jgi:UDP-N-acetylglucosamine:LPS N-acetylglucosamine transferase